MNPEISGGTEPDFGNLNPTDVENLEQEELINDNTLDLEELFNFENIEEEEGSTVEEQCKHCNVNNVNIDDQDELIDDTSENQDELIDDTSENQDEPIEDTSENQDEPIDDNSENQDEPFNDKNMNQEEFSMTLEKDEIDKNDIELEILVNDTRTQQEPFINKKLEEGQFIENVRNNGRKETSENNFELIQPDNDQVLKPGVHLNDLNLQKITKDDSTAENEAFIKKSSQEKAIMVRNTQKEEPLNEDVKEEQIIEDMTEEPFSLEMNVKQGFIIDKINLVNEEPVIAEITIDKTKSNVETLDIEMMPEPEKLISSQTSKIHLSPDASQAVISPGGSKKRLSQIISFPERLQLPSQDVFNQRIQDFKGESILKQVLKQVASLERSEGNFSNKSFLIQQALLSNDRFSNTLEGLSNQSFTTSDELFRNLSNIVNKDSSDSFPGLLGSFGEEAILLLNNKSFSGNEELIESLGSERDVSNNLTNVNHVELQNSESFMDEFGISEEEIFRAPSQAKLNNLTEKLVVDNTQPDSGESNFSDPAVLKFPIKEKSTIIKEESKSMKNLNPEMPNLDYLNLFQFIFNRPTFQNFDINMPGLKSNKDNENLGIIGVNNSVLKKLDIRETTQPFPVDLIHPEINPSQINQPTDIKQSSGNNRFIRGEKKKSELNQEPQIIEAIQIPTQSQRKHSIQLGSITPALGGVFSF